LQFRGFDIRWVAEFLGKKGRTIGNSGSTEELWSILEETSKRRRGEKKRK
jgi:hypothetical protein